MGSRKAQLIKSVVIDDPIFKASFLVWIGGQLNDAIKSYAKKLNREPWELENNNRIGHFGAYTDHRGGVIWFKNKKVTRVISHECLHAVHHVMQGMMVRLDDNSEEIFSHYLEWLDAEIRRLWGLKSKATLMQRQ